MPKKAVKKSSPAKKKSPAQSQGAGTKPVMMAGARTGAMALFVTVLGLAILAGGLYATAPFWLDHIKPYLSAALKDPYEDPRIQAVAKRAGAVDQLKQAQANDSAAIQKLNEERSKISNQLNALLKRMDEQDQSLKSMRKMIEATMPPSDAVDAKDSLSRLSEKLSRLDANKGALEKMLQRIAKLEKDEKEIVRITKRLKKLEASGPKTMDAVTGASATVLAVNQLRDAMRRPTPFVKELKLVKRLSAGNTDMLKAVDVLEPKSAKGISTIADLRKTFQQTAQDIVKADNMSSEQTWVDRILNRVKGLVTVRKIGEEGKISPPAVVSRVEEALESGNLEKALKLLSRLQGKAAEAAGTWVKNASARIDAERALASLHVQAVALLAPQQSQTTKTTN